MTSEAHAQASSPARLRTRKAVDKTQDAILASTRQGALRRAASEARQREMQRRLENERAQRAQQPSPSRPPDWAANRATAPLSRRYPDQDAADHRSSAPQGSAVLRRRISGDAAPQHAAAARTPTTISHAQRRLHLRAADSGSDQAPADSARFQSDRQGSLLSAPRQIRGSAGLPRACDPVTRSTSGSNAPRPSDPAGVISGCSHVLRDLGSQAISPAAATGARIDTTRQSTSTAAAARPLSHRGAHSGTLRQGSLPSTTAPVARQHSRTDSASGAALLGTGVRHQVPPAPSAARAFDSPVNLDLSREDTDLQRALLESARQPVAEAPVAAMTRVRRHAPRASVADSIEDEAFQRALLESSRHGRRSSGAPSAASSGHAGAGASRGSSTSTGGILGSASDTRPAAAPSSAFEARLTADRVRYSYAERSDSASADLAARPALGARSAAAARLLSGRRDSSGERASEPAANGSTSWPFSLPRRQVSEWQPASGNVERDEAPHTSAAAAVPDQDDDAGIPAASRPTPEAASPQNEPRNRSGGGGSSNRGPAAESLRGRIVELTSQLQQVRTLMGLRNSGAQRGLDSLEHMLGMLSHVIGGASTFAMMEDFQMAMAMEASTRGNGPGLGSSASYEELLQLEDVRVTASKAAVDALRRVPYATGAVKCTDCSICLLDFEPREGVVELPCKHAFHEDCVKQWLESYSKKCPICKAAIE